MASVPDVAGADVAGADVAGADVVGADVTVVVDDVLVEGGTVTVVLVVVDEASFEAAAAATEVVGPTVVAGSATAPGSDGGAAGPHEPSTRASVPKTTVSGGREAVNGRDRVAGIRPRMRAAQERATKNS